MRAKALPAVLVLTLLATVVPAGVSSGAAATQPTVTIERDCSFFPPDHGVRLAVSGFPPNTPVTLSLQSPTYTIGPIPLTLVTGGADFGTFLAAVPGTWTFTVALSGETLHKSLFVNCALPASMEECKNGGWRNFGVFENQGDCVSFIATGGKNAPANSP